MAHPVFSTQVQEALKLTKLGQSLLFSAPTLEADEPTE